jgi:hypothetical protein
LEAEEEEEEAAEEERRRIVECSEDRYKPFQRGG